MCEGLAVQILGRLFLADLVLVTWFSRLLIGLRTR
jgi:hypothetical protein